MKPNVEAKILSHSNHVVSVCFSPDQTKLCTSGIDERVILTDIDVQSENYLKTVKEIDIHEGYVWSVDYSKDGKFVASGSEDMTVLISSVESENFTTLEGHPSYVNCVRYNPNDTNKLISGGEMNTLIYWNIERMKPLRTMKKFTGTVYSLDLLPSDTGSSQQTLVTGDEEYIRVWDLRSGDFVHKIKNHEDYVYYVKFNPKNPFLLASGSRDKSIQILDFRNFKTLKKVESSNEVYSISYHPSGNFILAGGKDSTTKIFDVTPQKFELDGGLPLFEDCLDGVHKGSVYSVSFSPDGRRFATTSFDGEVFLWCFPHERYHGDEDEVERVKYLVERDLFVVDDDLGSRFVVKINLGGFCKLTSYKILVV